MARAWLEGRALSKEKGRGRSGDVVLIPKILAVNWSRTCLEVINARGTAGLPMKARARDQVLGSTAGLWLQWVSCQRQYRGKCKKSNVATACSIRKTLPYKRKGGRRVDWFNASLMSVGRELVCSLTVSRLEGF